MIANRSRKPPSDPAASVAYWLFRARLARIRGDLRAEADCERRARASWDEYRRRR